MKKSVITLATIGMLVATTTAVSAAGITLEDAQKKALDAVNLKEEQVIFKPVEEDVDDGGRIYEVDFFIPGELKYDFDIDVNTGAIVEQDMDLWEADDDVEYADLIKAAKDGKTDVTSSTSTETEKIDGEITEAQAKMIALKDSGLKADEVTFTKCKKDEDDGKWQYEVELKAKDGTEYDYELDVKDGKILDKDVDKD